MSQTLSSAEPYCDSIYRTKRFLTREVHVGNVIVGGHQPIRIQSMTTSNTRDVAGTVEQAIRLADSGCEIVRVTVQGIKEAEACEGIKNGLIQKGYTVPLVADIHFYPPAALHVADFVDKVRINPGNFADKRATFKVLEYDDASYARELERIEELFTPLVEKLKRLKKALRIGTNHGSLSDRIMNRYGDTPAGMVESAFEYTRICRKHDFHDIIFSMKASHPLVMIHAYRHLVCEMKKLGWDYPLHLGVTEAGEGEDGRVKSAIGIGTLLLDGLGDTIRVSLTEDPWCEVDPCKRLIQLYAMYQKKGVEPFEEHHRDYRSIKRKSPHLTLPFLHRDGTILLPAQQTATHVGQKEEDGLLFETEEPLAIRSNALTNAIPVYTLKKMPLGSLSQAGVLVKGNEDVEEMLKNENRPAFLLFSPVDSPLHEARRFFEMLKEKQIDIPVLLYFSYTCFAEDFVIRASAEAGALLSDGLGDGVALSAPHVSPELVRSLSFSILQAVRMRTSKTDFISCPGCGRTLFELQEVTKRIRARTGHLPGVKIAIMGCIVNGPGEMADADFGYVGSKTGMIDLYVGKQCVERNIPFDEAEERLVALIKSHNRWHDPL